VRADDFFAIDVSAEVATLCSSQIQGPWQIPTEVVRLANSRGASRIEIHRRWTELTLECDGAVAGPEELADVIRVLDPSVAEAARQDGIARLESTGGSALMWLCGLPGAHLDLECRSHGRAHRILVRRRGATVAEVETEPSSPSTVLRWRCSRTQVRRALAWMRTALRFLPIPVAIDGRPLERGFPDGLYRMRVADPLPAELAVTSAGDSPALWLLEHGVLSTRAVVPGYPAFSAAVEMSGAAPIGASAAELRAAANPYLPRLIAQASRMMVLLVDRLPSVEESVRERLATLTLRWALAGQRREQMVGLPVVQILDCGDKKTVSPTRLAHLAELRGGSLVAVDPDAATSSSGAGLVAVTTVEERSLLAELTGVRFEQRRTWRGPWDLVGRLPAALRNAWNRLRGLVGPRPLKRDRLSAGELRLIEGAASLGVPLALTAGAGTARRLGAQVLVGRERPEVRAAVVVAAAGDDWLYPALLAVGVGIERIPESVRADFVDGSILAVG
jgi:hypothetical protein